MISLISNGKSFNIWLNDLEYLTKDSSVIQYYSNRIVAGAEIAPGVAVEPGADVETGAEVELGALVDGKATGTEVAPGAAVAPGADVETTARKMVVSLLIDKRRAYVRIMAIDFIPCISSTLIHTQ
jgi:hypothetical protein